MKVAGFTFIRNAIKYDYPVVEAINSVLPICDKFFIAVGQSEDDTLHLIESINPDKIVIVETVWDDSLREGGKVLAVETNKAFKAIPEDYDWAVYIQGDEAVHEQYHAAMLEGMQKWINNPKVDGLLFNYQHFYGSYDYVGLSPSWYQHEIRIVKNNKDIYSYKDAQGFRKNNNEKLNVKAINAEIYHYGWVKHPEAMQKKQLTFNKLYHDDEWVDKNVVKADAFDYVSNIDALSLFKGSHPVVMQKRIDSINWKFDYDISFNKLKPKYKLKRWLKQNLGIHIGYKNYRRV